MTSTIPKDELETALEGASMENKTLIIAVANKACTKEGSLLDLLLQSFQVGEGTQLLHNHLLLAAIDQTAFEQCNLRGLHCYKLMTEGVDFSGESIFMSRDYLKITWMKTLFQANVLRRGYNFIFTDMDVIWMRNPFERLVHQGVDLQISCDYYNGNPSDLANHINTGFYFVVSNNKTISMFDKWCSDRDDSLNLHDQHMLQRLIENGLIQRLDLRLRFLNPLYFGGFCANGGDYGKVVTMHANCCVTIDAKTRDLRAILDGWIKFKGQSNATSTVQWPDHSNCIRSWSIDHNRMSSSSNHTLTTSNHTS
ncbi:Nucleotide-diphospho-sugar transferase [Cinnamomum micranthum f. kanehirae]|uniref:Glycosyltransferase n=1 Tax=Cinnamomum micranthum f. kanehirae TaxID=337451 RepID=A0A443NQM7_9MAGN|nr:Nucleotide-diphospho-sugar transferase [Cinnamomum micranthum f. kanehirae]